MESAIDSAVSKVALENFEAKAREAIASFVSGNDVFVSLPTGYGKSSCYVILPLVFDELLQRSGSIVLLLCCLPVFVVTMRFIAHPSPLTHAHKGTVWEHQAMGSRLCGCLPT